MTIQKPKTTTNHRTGKKEVVLPPLPDIGEPVPTMDLIKLAQVYGKKDIVKNLQNNPWPTKTFVSDGCSMWPDSWAGKDLYRFCFWHDVRYWCGLPGDDYAKLYADSILMLEVGKNISVNLGRLMFTGVQLGGSEKFHTPFRWGYGR